MSDKKYKIGLGITTKDRSDYFIQSIKTIPENKIDFLCVVNDGYEYSDEVYANSKIPVNIIQHPKNLGIACAKNSALRVLIQNDCDFLFLMEDDVLINNPNVFEKYIKASQISGLWHMNFGFSNIYNFNQDGSRNIRELVEYDEENSVIFTQNLVAGFQFFHKSVIKNIGYMDERYTRFNNLEHVDHSYRVVKAGLLPAYWWWPDINNSWEYLSIIPDSIENSTVRDDKFMQKFQMASSIFQNKFNYNPVSVPDTSKEQVLNSLNTIQNNYARKLI